MSKLLREFEEFQNEVNLMNLLFGIGLEQEEEVEDKKQKNNKVIKTKYDKTYHKFSQEITENGEVTHKSDTFSRPSMDQKIIVNEPAVICILDDGSKGVSKCMDEDLFDENKGIKIAYIKAKIKSLQKELKVLSK